MRQLSYFCCGNINHLGTICPKWKKLTAEKVNFVNVSTEFDPSFAPYLSEAVLNDRKFTILRDTGSSFDLAPRKFIKSEHFSGELVWVKLAFGNSVKCLPVANIKLELKDYGIVNTQAAIVDLDVEMSHSLLGHGTQEILDKSKRRPKLINRMVTRSQNKASESANPLSPQGEIGEVSTIANPGEIRAEGEVPDEGSQVVDPSIVIPERSEDQILKLGEIKAEEFREEQKRDSSLTKLSERGKDKKNTEFIIENRVLLRTVADLHGYERKQIVISEHLRRKILNLAHEKIGAHLG